MKQPTEWVVTTTPDRPLREIAQDLAAAGLQVDQVMEEIGIVTGRCDSAAASRLRKVRGVAAVERNRPVDIGPPDADVS